MRLALVVLPLAAIVISVDRRWGEGDYGLLAACAAFAVIAAAAPVWAWRSSVSLFGAALTVDRRAELKGRLSSALFFLGQEDVDEPRRAQIEDAARHAERLDLGKALRARWPRAAYLTPVFLALFVLSFLVPPAMLEETASAAVESRKANQLAELDSLTRELEDAAAEEEDLREIVARLREVEDRFEQGEATERDVMIALSKLEESIENRMSQLSAKNLNAEIDALVPLMMAGAPTQPAAEALKKGKMKKASAEMQKLGEKMKQGELSAEDKEKLTMTAGLAASKLGTKSSGSFGGDFDALAQSMKLGDGDESEEAMRSIGNKLRNVELYRKLMQSRSMLNMSKMALGHQGKPCDVCNGKGGQCSACNGSGLSKGQSQGLANGGGKGGLRAGTAATGSPFGEGSRLADSYRNLVKVQGLVGDGPVQSEVEITEGQASNATVSAQDVYAEYSAVAEEAIEREEIPLTHRFHVKRYFQAIRPVE